jgi:hypothetical protein
MLVRIVLNSETAMVFSAVASIFTGWLMENSFFFAVHFFIGSVVGAHNLAYSEDRTILVKAGVKVGLVNAITILCHIGTSLITFFYQKARNQEDPQMESVDEGVYRYPGPKPQTKEAGLVLLADAVEAASRTLLQPTPAHLQGLVQKIINSIFTDGQLDECELTLKDLHQIARNFNLILAGIHHQRVDYPVPAAKENTGKKKNNGNLYKQPAKTARDRYPEDKRSGEEDLRRLGM